MPRCSPSPWGSWFSCGRRSLHGPIAPMTLLAVGTLLYFVVLARRIYSSQLNSLAFQAEKDLLIGELEQAKAISDERAASRRGGEPRQIAVPRHHVA